MIIYRVTNLINDKVYVGQTIQSLEKRKKQHQRSSKRLLISLAIKKYRKENFKWESIQECKTQDELNLAEIAWIKKLNCMRPNGYNRTNGGSTTTGYKYTPEQRKRVSDATKGEKNPFYGKKHSTETRAYLRSLVEGVSYAERLSPKELKRVLEKKSNSMKGKNTGPKSDETKRKISETRIREGTAKGEKNPRYGKAVSLETREKIRVSNTGRHAGEKHHMYGKHHSEETRKKMSLSKIGKIATGETKRKMREAHARRKALVQLSQAVEAK